MSDATFETFLVSGLLVLIAAVAFLAWAAWRWVDRERDMEKLAMAGIGYELRHNLRRMMSELAGVADGSVKSDIEIVPVVHPQLDALLSRPNEADRTGLTTIRGHYNELSAHKQSLRAAMVDQTDLGVPANVAADAVIDSLATLYLWEEHKGCAPEIARSTRSWDVRDWMKAHNFHAGSLPGLHLRDQVVERLRQKGMTLTPKPLTYTASEYFAKQYDRKADPNAPFWKRKPKPLPVAELEAPAEEVLPDEVRDEVVEPVTEQSDQPAPAEPEIVEPEIVEEAPAETAAETPEPITVASTRVPESVADAEDSFVETAETVEPTSDSAPDMKRTATEAT